MLVDIAIINSGINPLITEAVNSYALEYRIPSSWIDVAIAEGSVYKSKYLQLYYYSFHHLL